MARMKELNPGAGLRQYYGSELRHARLAAGKSQEQLGRDTNYSGAQVGRVESGERMASLTFSRGADVSLDTGERFQGLWKLMQKYVPDQPSGFWEYLEEEGKALSIRMYSALAVPGLLQTEGYARALLRAGKPRDTAEEINELVTRRLERQEILGRPRPPMLWLAVDESVLRRPVGGPAVMAPQLGHMAEAADRPGINLEVVPLSAGAHSGLLGEFIMLGYGDGSQVAYTESVESSQIIEQPEKVEAFDLAFDTLRGVTMSPEASIELILRIKGEYERGAESRRMA
jgi:transcriptional regulator with XRE-family HTH domain